MDANNEKSENSEEINNEEIITDLKVKADAQDITPDERKRSVKKLAGAISHSLRARGEINVRAFGSAAIGKATKALSIALNYISAQNLQLECSPAFITAKMGENELTGISFVTFASEKNPDIKPVDINKVKTVLRVQADPQDVEPEERKKNVKKLAGSIAHALQENKEVIVRSFGNACLGKTAKSLAISRGYTAVRGVDMYCYPFFIVADMNGNERTGIAWYVHTNEI
jgi:stage V sporulation protein SpoVS